MGQRTHYDRGSEADAISTAGFSGFWGDCRIIDSSELHREVYGYTEQFLALEEMTSTGMSADGKYHCFIENSAVFGTDATRGGRASLVTGATDDNEIIVQALGTTTAGDAPFQISQVAADKRKLWYETTIETVEIAGTESFFIGLCENFVPGAGDVLADATMVPKSTTSLIGFHFPEADTTTCDVIYQETGQSLTTPINGGITLAANTKIRLGIKYDPSRANAEQITFYVNGIPQATFVTFANIEAAAFPEAIPFVPTWCLKTGTSATYTVRVHNWACWQEY